MMIRSAWTVGIGLIVAAMGCGGDSKSPTSPTPVAATVSSIALSGYGATFTSAGQTQSLRATAQLTDGSSRDITSVATWTSDATGVATVQGGVVTARSAGDATITATHEGRAGHQRVRVDLPREALPRITASHDVRVSPEPLYLFRSELEAEFSETGGVYGYSVNFINTTFRDWQGQVISFRNWNPGDLQRIWGSNYVRAGGRQGILIWVDYNRTLSTSSVEVVMSVTDDLGNSRQYGETYRSQLMSQPPSLTGFNLSMPAKITEP